MGLLSLFSKPNPAVQRLPHGSLTLDRDANIVASTISSGTAPALLHDIGHQVLHLFREARKAQLPLTELNLHFGSLQITAREMRGGAIVFLKPKDLYNGTLPNDFQL
jgi:hypothetical protein